MEVLPIEIISLICSYLPLRSALGLSESCKQLRSVVDSDAVYPKKLLEQVCNKWSMMKRVNSAVENNLERIKLKFSNQLRWQQLNTAPVGFGFPVKLGKDTHSEITIKCKKNRLLVLSKTANTCSLQICMYDLETMQKLAATETWTPHSPQVLWKGGNLVLFYLGGTICSWNIVDEVFGKALNNPYSVYFDGEETIIFCSYDNNKWKRKNMRTNEIVDCDWILFGGSVNGSIKAILHKKPDKKYYLDKFDNNWELISSVQIDLANYSMRGAHIKITKDFLFISNECGHSRVFSVHDGSHITQFSLGSSAKLYRMRYFKGVLIAENRLTGHLVDAMEFKDGQMNQLLWPLFNKKNKKVLKMLTPDLMIIKQENSVAFAAPKMTKEIVSEGKFVEPYAKLVPATYQKWNVLDAVVSETQIIFHVQSHNKQQNAIVVLDFCNSVITHKNQPARF